MAGVLTNEQFPCPPGNLPWSVADIAGPASYTQVTAGSPIAGGQAVSSVQLGLSVSTIWAQSMGSDDGTYDIVVFLNPFSAGQGQTGGVTLMWIVAATGAQVSAATNLSGRTVRIMAMGR